jgi:hypothetical protein
MLLLEMIQAMVSFLFSGPTRSVEGVEAPSKDSMIDRPDHNDSNTMSWMFHRGC